MVVTKVSFSMVSIVVLLCAMMVMLPMAGAQSPAPAPVPASDGQSFPLLLDISLGLETHNPCQTNKKFEFGSTFILLMGLRGSFEWA